MKKWVVYRITNSFDSSVVEISWDGIKVQDAKSEVKELSVKSGKSIKDYNIRVIR